MADRCQAMEVILSFTASGSLADSSGNYVHSFKAVSSSASWVCCFWLVAVSSHLPCPSHGLNVALKMQELDPLHLPLTRAQINNSPCCSLTQALVLLPGAPLPLEKPQTLVQIPPRTSKAGECVATTTAMMGKLTKSPLLSAFLCLCATTEFSV